MLCCARVQERKTQRELAFAILREREQQAFASRERERGEGSFCHYERERALLLLTEIAAVSTAINLIFSQVSG